MILVIDNYDSFTYNLVHLIGESTGATMRVVRNDAIDAEGALAAAPDAIIISPGPGTPDQSGASLAIVAAAARAKTPVFGVCLGLQTIAQTFGGRIVRAQKLMHGKTSKVRHDGAGLFAGLPDKFQATRYHSLIADPTSLDATSLKVCATSDDDGEIMAIQHASLPIAGVQFHPESIASDHGAAIFNNFQAWAADLA